MEIIYIQSEIDNSSMNTYKPYYYSKDLSKILNSYEYGDVINNAYQIWEYPSGSIYRVDVDRISMMDNTDYSTPHPNKWLPKLVYVKSDQEKVSSALNSLKLKDKII